MLAELSVRSLLGALLWVVVAGLVFFILDWLIGYIGLPEPFRKVARVIIGLVAVILLINWLMGIA